MTQEQALNTLVQGVHLAQTKGAYSLDEAVVLREAISVFQLKQQEAIVEGESKKELKVKK